MQYYLLEYAVNGIKSLNKEIKLSFYNNILTKDIDLKGNNIKAIYGENGSGKSAIVHGIEFYKNIMSFSNDFNSSMSKEYYKELINKETKNVYLSFIYAFVDDNNKSKKTTNVYKHVIEFGLDEYDNLIIKKEDFLKLNGTKRIKDENFNILFSSENGKLLKLDFSKKINNTLKKITANTLESNSFLMTFYKYIRKSEKKYALLDILDLIVGVGFQANLLYINLAGDNHHGYSMSKLLESNDEITNDIKELLNKPSFIINSRLNKIAKDNFSSYEKYIKKVETFIKLFKKNLYSIDIKTTEDSEYYYCELLFNYKTYVVSEEYESTGIKKLTKLYSSFESMYKGCVLFIDEFDANLHDVYFTELVKFLMENAKGQLIITTHNISLMECIKKNKHSIDFLSSDSILVPWVKNGNYKPSVVYKEGMIPYSPFNIEANDFMRAFYYDE